MLPELGNLLLYCTLILCFFGALLSVFGKGNYFCLASYASLLTSLGAMAILIYCFISSDFSVKLVFNNSHQLKPLIFKISAAWGNHEGSMLLWVINIILFNVLFLTLSPANHDLKRITSLVQNCLSLAFTIFLIWQSNPFDRIFPAPLAGKGLNPILQDIGLAMHPPLLYLGYVGFSLVFSITVACASLKTPAKEFAKIIRIWVLIPWTFLTVGIALGSNWAYRELGWGGYWFWDPVENASLMPWLASTALIHGLLVLARSGSFYYYCAFLGVITFGLSQVGTLIVRSGLITSVHSFAVDPSRGYLILAIMGVITFIGLIAIAFSPASSSSKISFKGFAVYVGSLILLMLALIVLFGTLYPILHELITSQNVAIGADFYNEIFQPFVVLTLLLMIYSTIEITKLRIAITIATFFIVYHFSKVFIFSAIIALCATLIITSLLRYRANLKNYGSIVGHLGVALLVMSVSINGLLSREYISQIKVGQSVNLNGFNITLNDLKLTEGANYIAKIANFRVSNDTRSWYVESEQRFFQVEKQITTEVGTVSTHLYDLYFALGETNPDHAVAFRFYYLPGISVLWLSYIILAASGAIACLQSLAHLRLSSTPRPRKSH